MFAEQRLLHIQDLARLHYNGEEDEKETSPNELISGWGTKFTAHTDHSIQTEKIQLIIQIIINDNSWFNGSSMFIVRDSSHHQLLQLIIQFIINYIYIQSIVNVWFIIK